jgi:glycine oxidase
VRGEVIRVYAPEVQIQRPIRLIHPRYPLYIAPKPNHVYVIGATEIESEDCSPMSVRSALELLSAAYSIHPGFAEARILEMSSQCRPAFNNNLPKIYWDGQRYLAINGLYRHGYLIAPALVEATQALIQYIHHPYAMTYPDWQAQQPWPTLFHTRSEAYYGSIH